MVILICPLAALTMEQESAYKLLEEDSGIDSQSVRIFIVSRK